MNAPSSDFGEAGEQRLRDARKLLGVEKPLSPTILRKDGYRFFFFSREETRMHVHVVPGNGEAKYWLEPSITLARSYNYSQRQLWAIKSLVEEYQHEFIAEWKRHFNG